MNERIKELVVESGNGQMRDGRLYPHIGIRFEEDWQRFAELIVRECTTVVASVPPCHGDYRDQIEVGMRDHCARVILDHFELK